MAKYKKILVLLALAICARLAFASIFPPLAAPDTASYLKTAKIFTGDFSGYDGFRTPLYPFVLFLFDGNFQAVALFQHLLGLLTCLLIFQIFSSIFQNESIGFAAGLSHALNPGQIVVERAMLTEATAALLVTASTLVLLHSLQKKNNFLLCLLTGTLGALAALVKPLYLFLPVLFSIFIAGRTFLSRERKISLAVSRFMAAILPAVIILGAWSLFNQNKTGYFGITTISGFSLISHTGSYIELAPERYDTIKKIYLKHREIRIREAGEYSNVIWLAREELMEKTGMDFLELSGKLNEISRYLVLHHPLKYFKSFLRSIVPFWRPAWYTGQGGIRAALGSGDTAMVALVVSYVALHLGLTAVFLLFPLIYLLYRPLRKLVAFNYKLAAVYAIVFTAAFSQAAMIYGDNSRYKLPVEPLMLAAAVAIIFSLIRALKFPPRKS